MPAVLLIHTKRLGGSIETDVTEETVIAGGQKISLKILIN